MYLSLGFSSFSNFLFNRHAEHVLWTCYTSPQFFERCYGSFGQWWPFKNTAAQRQSKAKQGIRSVQDRGAQVWKPAMQDHSLSRIVDNRHIVGDGSSQFISVSLPLVPRRHHVLTFDLLLCRCFPYKRKRNSSNKGWNRRRRGHTYVFSGST